MSLKMQVDQQDMGGFEKYNKPLGIDKTKDPLGLSPENTCSNQQRALAP